MKITIERDDGTREVYEGASAAESAIKALGAAPQPVYYPPIVIERDRWVPVPRYVPPITWSGSDCNPLPRLVLCGGTISSEAMSATRIGES